MFEVLIQIKFLSNTFYKTMQGINKYLQGATEIFIFTEKIKITEFINIFVNFKKSILQLNVYEFLPAARLVKLYWWT